MLLVIFQDGTIPKSQILFHEQNLKFRLHVLAPTHLDTELFFVFFYTTDLHNTKTK